MIYRTFWPWHMKKRSYHIHEPPEKIRCYCCLHGEHHGKTSGESKNSNVRIWKQKNQPRKWWPSIVPAEFLPLSLPFFSPGQFPTSDWWLHYAKIDWAAMGHLMFFWERTSHKMRERWWTWCDYPSSRTLFFFLLFVHFPNRIWDRHVTGNRESQGKQHWSYHATCVHLHRPCISHPDSFFAFSDFSFFSFFGFLSPPRQSPCNTQLQTLLRSSKYFFLSIFSMFHHWNSQSAHWDLDALQQEHPTTWPMV